LSQLSNLVTRQFESFNSIYIVNVEHIFNQKPQLERTQMCQK